VHDAAAYVAAISSGKGASQSIESVTDELALEEELFLGLRQLAGIDLARLKRQYGVNLEEKIMRLASNGMVERQGDMLRLAADKLAISNEVIVELLR
jgi:oxygen-independent coproporphyrinogen-3 oxidase